MNTHLLLIAHAPLASALRDCALHVFPECAAEVSALDVPADQAPEATLAAAHALLRGRGEGAALLLTDVYGATPCNVALRLLQETAMTREMQLLAGVNLPMLLRAVNYRHETLPSVAQRALEGGTLGMRMVSI